MPIDPRRLPQSDKVKAIQRTVYADLPPPDPTEAFVIAWVDDPSPGHPAGFYLNIVSTPTDQHQWVWIGPGGAGGLLLPDLRFVVARFGYGNGTLGDIVPGTTYTNADPAVAFNAAISAAAAYRAILQAYPEFAANEAHVTVMLHPDHYVGSFTIPGGVTVAGLGSSPADTLVDRVRFDISNGLSSSLRNVFLLGDALTPPAAGSALASSGSGAIDLIEVRSTSSSSVTAVFAHDGSVSSTESELPVVSWQPAQLSALVSGRSRYQKLTLGNVSLRSREDQIIGLLDGTPTLSLSGGSSLLRDVTIGAAEGVAGAKSIHVFLASGASLFAQNVGFLQQATPGGFLFDASGDTAPSSLFIRGVTAPSPNDFYGPPSRLTVTPLGSHEAASFFSSIVNVPAPGFQTVAYNGTPDILEIGTNYQQPNTDTTFVLLPLPSAAFLAPGRSILVKNTSDPSQPTSGGLALVTAAGQTINGLASSAAPASVTSASHVIVPAGSQVSVCVNSARSGYLVRSV